MDTVCTINYWAIYFLRQCVYENTNRMIIRSMNFLHTKEMHWGKIFVFENILIILFKSIIQIKNNFVSQLNWNLVKKTGSKRKISQYLCWWWHGVNFGILWKWNIKAKTVQLFAEIQVSWVHCLELGSRFLKSNFYQVWLLVEGLSLFSNQIDSLLKKQSFSTLQISSLGLKINHLQ